MPARRALFLVPAALLLLVAVARAQSGAEYLNQRLGQAVSQFAPGYQLAGQVQTGKLPAKGSSVHHVGLEGGKCYRAIAVGDADLTNLDVRLQVGRAPELARDTATDNVAVATYCPEGSTRVDVHVTAVAGR